MPNHEDRTDAEAFLRQAMADWGDAVYRLALSQTRSRADAEDVYQDVFLKLHSDATAFESPEHVKAWLLRVTVNRCRDLARSGWKRRTVALDPEWDAPDTPARDDEDAAVWDAVGHLPEQQRTAVHLHYVEGYSTDEIARALDCRPATARTWLFRARARIKELLEGDTSEEGLQAEPETTGRPDTPAKPRPPNISVLRCTDQPQPIPSILPSKGGLS